MQSYNKHRSQQGITLIEMSMVLLIIALISGAIFMSQALIRQSELRNLAGEFDITRKAIEEFRDKYTGLPGDLRNAESIWGSDADCPATAPNITPKIETCNGDNSGTIGSSTATGDFSNTYEWFRAWQHLSNAGLIQGSFTGVRGAGGMKEAVIGENVPASKLPGAGWTLNYMLMHTNGALWGDQYGHLLNFGGSVEEDYTKAPVLSPQEAYIFDLKIDDGIPNTGTVRTWRDVILPDCTYRDDYTGNIAYDADVEEHTCSLVFLLGF